MVSFKNPKTPRKPKRQPKMSYYDLLIGAIVAGKHCTEKQAQKILLDEENCNRILAASHPDRGGR